MRVLPASLFVLFFLFVPCFAPAAEPQVPLEQVTSAKRILFLGDSITASGKYVAAFDAWLATRQFLHSPAGSDGFVAPVVIDGGLSSETVSGLSEEGHADGKFPRPDLHERLDRILKITKPDLVFACYGINCAIYAPFSEDRFSRYQAGCRLLKQKVEATGAKFIAITPPFYDDTRKPLGDFSYNEVLDRYSAWLVSQREQGWQVIDLHSGMTAEMAARRKNDAAFTFQPDAVHPNDAGHWYIASQLIAALGDERSASAGSPSAMLELNGLPPAAMNLFQRRVNVLRDAYVGAAGHKRPGVAKGLPIDEAEAKHTAISRDLAEQINQARK